MYYSKIFLLFLSFTTITISVYLFNQVAPVFTKKFNETETSTLKMVPIVIRHEDRAPIDIYAKDPYEKKPLFEWYLENIIELGTRISQLEENELSPGPIANTLFSRLVSIVSNRPTFNVSQIFDNPTVQRLQPLVIEKCSTAEYLLEADFSKKVISKSAKVSDFLYYKNYELLIDFEIRSLEKYMFPVKVSEISQLAVIGSGPLPLTSIVLGKHLKGAKIRNIDYSEEANMLGKAIVSYCNSYDRISFVTCNVLDLDVKTLADADVVYLAALVGNNSQEKRKIIHHLYKIMKPGSILVARSSRGLREFIYQPLLKEDFGQFDNFQQFDPDNKVIINSIAVTRKPIFRHFFNISN